MLFPIYAPRVNNNDDMVRVGRLLRAPGQKVNKGDPVIEVETDKALFEVEAEGDGFLLECHHKQGDEVPIGTVLVWIGSTPEEQVPSDADRTNHGNVPNGHVETEITAKAKVLLERHRISASEVARGKARITIADVEAYLAAKNSTPAEISSSRPSAAELPEQPAIPGTVERLSPEERGMLRTVLWHRDEAVPGYVEMQYDAERWTLYARRHMEDNRLLMPALLPLMAYRLVTIATELPKINATLAGQQRYVYGQVNLGFTVQGGSSLYLVVIANAGRLSEREFVDTLSELQRKATSKTLCPEQAGGATLAFSSMARWNVSRHVPVLPPHCSLIIGHAAPKGGPAVLGATYDHRVLTGYDALNVLQKLATPPEREIA
jgi:pyruvate/2-oxoglutarate dehydrogenase complex dihydrolipoamide acyltransferase (E2) component